MWQLSFQEVENKSVRESISRKQASRESARKHPSTKNGLRVSLRAGCPPVYRAVTTKKNTAHMIYYTKNVLNIYIYIQNSGNMYNYCICIYFKRYQQQNPNAFSDHEGYESIADDRIHPTFSAFQWIRQVETRENVGFHGLMNLLTFIRLTRNFGDEITSGKCIDK